MCERERCEEYCARRLQEVWGQLRVQDRFHTPTEEGTFRITRIDDDDSLDITINDGNG